MPKIKNLIKSMYCYSSAKLAPTYSTKVLPMAGSEVTVFVTQVTSCNQNGVGVLFLCSGAFGLYRDWERDSRNVQACFLNGILPEKVVRMGEIRKRIALLA